MNFAKGSVPGGGEGAGGVRSAVQTLGPASFVLAKGIPGSERDRRRFTQQTARSGRMEDHFEMQHKIIQRGNYFVSSPDLLNFPKLVCELLRVKS
ncbi:hypothetical protein chiPu_0021002 [Chiloscyllium punctatum]|uniref:Uncharacterized protein n=1 Tax=Chiloscyllium punctatum TaxID=137246 RepID=A0A401RM22_CHIPU|nr:hypothetical protein [Chiloscyllium punctatum]